MTTLKSLAQSAMLGTGNGFTPPVMNQHRIPDSDPEAALLASAALVGIAEMGGSRPVHLAGGDEVSPAESKAQMPGKAIGLYKRVFSEKHEWILPEFLELVAARGLVVPPETLPTLLGSVDSDLRSLVIQVMGERGRWLAGQNPAWSYALGREPWDAWEHGTRPERVTALEQVRATDPGQARAWVQTTWEQDTSEDRAAFLRTFAIGLSMEDEPFLEACLDDKRKEVRDAARGLLINLEQSRFSQRMWRLAKPILRLKSKFLGGEKLEVTLPENLDTAAKRDGVSGQTIRKKMGEKANLLAQLLSLVPPARWSQEFGRTPEKLIAAALNCEWKEPVLLGWQMATCNAKDPDWAETIATLWVTQNIDTQLLEPECLEEMIPLMRVEKVEALVNHSIMPSLKELNDQSLLLSLLEKYHRPWTAKVARTVIRSAQRQSENYLYRLPMALPGFALWIPTELAVELTTGWPAEPKGPWRERIDTFCMRLHLRKEIQQSLLE